MVMDGRRERMLIDIIETMMIDLFRYEKESKKATLEKAIPLL
jgi:hypothetical protein